MNHGIVGYGNSTHNAKGQWHYSNPSYRAKHYESCMFIWQVPMGLEIVLKVLKFFNVPNSVDDFNFFLLLEMGY